MHAYLDARHPSQSEAGVHAVCLRPAAPGRKGWQERRDTPPPDGASTGSCVGTVTAAAGASAAVAIRSPLCGLLRDPAHRVLDLLERVLLLLEVLLEERDHALLAHRLRLADEPFIDGDLMVLGRRRSGQDHAVDNRLVAALHVRPALLVMASITGHGLPSGSSPSSA